MAARDECYSPLSYSPLSSPVSRYYFNDDGSEATAGGHHRKDSGQLLDEAWETLADETPLSVPPQHDIVPRSRSSTSPLHSRPGGTASKISESDLRNFANFVKTKTVTESAGGGSGRSSSGGASGGGGKDGGGKFQRLWSFRNGAKGGEEGGDGGGGGTAGTGTGGSGTAGSAEGRSGGSGKKERFLEQVIKTGGQAARVWSNPRRRTAAPAPPPKVAYFSFDRHREAVAEAEQLDAEEEAASRQGRRREAFKSASFGSSSGFSAGGAGDGVIANGGAGWPGESGGNVERSAQVLRRGAKGGSFESMAQAGPIGGVGEFGSGRRSGVARGAKGEGSARAWEVTITQDGDYGEGKDDERELTPTRDASSKHRRGFRSCSFSGIGTLNWTNSPEPPPSQLSSLALPFPNSTPFPFPFYAPLPLPHSPPTRLLLPSLLTRSRSFSGIGTLNGTNSPEAPTLPGLPSSPSPNPGSPLSSERRTYSPHASLPTSSSSSRVRPPRSSTAVILPPLAGHHPHHRSTISHRRTVSVDEHGLVGRALMQASIEEHHQHGKPPQQYQQQQYQQQGSQGYGGGGGGRGDYDVEADDESPGRSPYSRPQARRNRTEVTRRRPSTAMPYVGGGSEDGSYRRSRSVGHGYELYLPPVSGGIGAAGGGCTGPPVGDTWPAGSGRESMREGVRRTRKSSHLRRPSLEGEGCYEGRGEREAGSGGGGRGEREGGSGGGRGEREAGNGGGSRRAGGDGEEESRVEEGERRRVDYVRQRESSQQQKQQYADGRSQQQQQQQQQPPQYSSSPLRLFHRRLNRCFNLHAAATAGVSAPSADAAAVTRLVKVVNGGAAGTNALTAAVENFATRSISVAAQASLIASVALLVSSSPAVAADDVAVDVASAPLPQEIRRSSDASRQENGIPFLARVAASQLRTAPLLTVTSTDILETTDAAETAAAETAEAPKVLDGARLLTESQRGAMLRQLSDLESRDGWRIRVATRYGVESGLDGKQIRDLWQPSDRTVIVVADVASPNILSFSIGEAVRSKLPYQFFTELQSRYGNQFFVRQEGESEALTRSVDAIRTCLAEPNGCLKVPGLVDDLYFLTLGVSVAAGAVFGFSARLPPQGQVEASWQWVAIFSPLWLLLLLAFGVFPVVDRTADLEPLIKNLLGFAGGAGAVYMTPILGESPVARVGKTLKDNGDI
ncbi:unnamed protein product [Closterium sp. NIES-65]|nr:unnamed protein product [Closterium sp. NIES-65]